MELLGVLISFALVGNVLVTNTDDYLQQVIETNLAISHAKEFMPRVIKEMILNDEEYGMQEIAFMLSAAERIDFKLIGRPENTNVAPVVRAPVIHHIPFVNLVPQEGSIQLFGTYINPDPTPVIKPYPEELNQDRIPVINLDPEQCAHGPSRSQVPDLNLDPSTLPEEVSKSENPNLATTTIIDFEEKLQFQKTMRLAILAVTDRLEYERIVESARKVQEDPIPVHRINLNRKPKKKTRTIKERAIKRENIDKVLEKRRIDPAAVTNKRVIRALGLDSLAKVRRQMTLEAITSLIRQNDPAFRDLYLMCRLVGAFRSIKYPSSFIIEVDVVEDERCILTDLTNENSTAYEFIEVEFWEVDLHTGAEIKPFLSELE